MRKNGKQLETGIVVSENNLPQGNSPESLIALAITQGASIETVEKMMTMRREFRAEKIKAAFDDAMAKFQGQCPIIEKTTPGAKTNSGLVAYKYADLDAIVTQTKKLIEDNGFSYLLKAEYIGEKVRVTCIVKHKLGHSEESTMELPFGTKTGVMSAPQQAAAAMTYAKRYAFCNAFGIMTGDEDTDAQKPATESKPTNTVLTTTSAPKSPPAKPPQATESATPGVLLECHECASPITKAEQDFSKQRFGKSLCRNCQKGK